MRTLVRLSGLLLVLCVVPAAPAIAQSADVTGTMHVVWGDPPSPTQPPVLRFFLVDDAGREHELVVPDEVMALHGGIVGVNRKRVTIRSDALEPSPGAFRRVRSLWLAPLTPETGNHALIATAVSSAVITRPYVTILCRFADTPTVTPYPPAHFETLMGATYPGVNHFWMENTENLINLNGSVVVGWYNLPSPRSAYLNSAGNADLSKLSNDCTAAADADVNFTLFSGINLQFNGRLDCCSWGGSRTMLLDGVLRTFPMTWEADWAAAAIGTYAHEVGHSLGLPHSGGPYGRTYDSRWDVMSASSVATVTGTPYTVGTHTNAHHKNLLGVVPSTRRVVATDSVTRVLLERSAQPRANSYAQVIQVPLTNDAQIFYTVEARRRVGYDAPVPGEAVVIHDVMPGRNEPARVIDPDGNGNTNDAGAMWTVGEVFRDLAYGITITVDSVTNEAFAVTVRRNAFAAVTVTPTSRARTLPAGPSVVQDSARVVGVAPWQATTRSRRLRITTPAGTGAATLRWRSELTGLAPGLYVDTIRISGGASAWPALLVDTLDLTAPAATALQMSVSATSRVDSIVLQRTGTVDTVRLRFHGPNASTAAWNATGSNTGTTFFLLPTGGGGTVVSGNGDATIRWYHFAGARPAGLYVDTVIITALGAAGNPLLIVDTVSVYDAPVATVTRLGPTRTEMGLGAGPMTDSARVQFNGRWSSVAGWRVSPVRPVAQRFLTPPNIVLTGDRTFTFTRAPGTRAPGIYIDTLRVQPSMAGTNVFPLLVDTLVVVDAPITLALSWSGRRSIAWLGSSVTHDSVLVKVGGPGATGKQWQATAPTARITLSSRDAFTATGVNFGTAWLRWHRNVGTRGPGVYVDTITVALSDTVLSVQLIDTLQVVQSPASVSAPSRRTVSLTGITTLRDSVNLDIIGFGNANAAWTATARASWLSLLTTSGIGSSLLRWTRQTAGLSPGVYVDTIAVSVPAVPASARVIDSLLVVNPVGVASDSLRTGAIAVVYRDSLRGTGGDGRFTWTLAQGALPAGITLATNGVLQGTPTQTGSYDVTVRATSVGFAGTRALRLTVLAARVIVTSSTTLRNGLMGAAYADTMRATAGGTTITWSITSGELPLGLTLDAEAGVIAGVPEQAGTFNLGVRARAGTTDTIAALTLRVIKPVIAENAVVDHVLGIVTLPPEQVRFLDLLGNRNGRADVGDVRAWLQDVGRLPAPNSPLQLLLDSVKPESGAVAPVRRRP